MGGRPLFSAKASGTASNASANDLIAYCTTKKQSEGIALHSFCNYELQSRQTPAQLQGVDQQQFQQQSSKIFLLSLHHTRLSYCGLDSLPHKEHHEDCAWSPQSSFCFLYSRAVSFAAETK